MFIGILRKTKAGRECLIYRHPEETRRCNVFLKIKEKGGRSVAVCAKCREIYKSLPKTDESERNVAKIPVTDCTFGFNPLHLAHLPSCRPSKFRSVMETFDSFAQSQSAVIDQPTGSIPVEEKETEKESEDQHSVDKGADRGSIATRYPVDVCMVAGNPKNPIFVYKISEETNKCYKFVVTSRMGGDSNKFYFTLCSGCHSLKSKAHERGETPIPLSSKKCDGSHLLSDPLTNHLPGCEPMNYDDVIKKSPLVIDIVKEKIARGEDISKHLYPHGSPFPLPKLRSIATCFPVDVCMAASNPTRPIFLYKFSEEPNKCYKFIVSNGMKYDSNGDYRVRCSGCHSLNIKAHERGETPIPQSSKKCDGSHLLSDPLTNHLPGCEPMNYDDVIEKSPLVHDIVKEKIARGEDISMHLYPHGSPFSEPLDEPKKDYLLEMSMKGRNPIRPQFIYRLPDCQLCYRFRTMTKKPNHFSIVCFGCEVANSKERRLSGNSPFVPSRRSDGRRLICDPQSGHLAGCEPYDYKECLQNTPLVTDIVKEMIIKGKDISIFLPPKGTPFTAVAEASPSTGYVAGSDTPVGNGDTSVTEQGARMPPSNVASVSERVGRKDVAMKSDSDSGPEEDNSSRGSRQADIALRVSLPRRAKEERKRADSDSEYDDVFGHSMEDDDDTMDYADSMPPRVHTDDVIKNGIEEGSSPDPAVPSNDALLDKHLDPMDHNNNANHEVMAHDDNIDGSNVGAAIDAKPKKRKNPDKKILISGSHSLDNEILAAPLSRSIPISHTIRTENLHPRRSVKRIKIEVSKKLKFKKEFDTLDFKEDEVEVTIEGSLLKVVFEKKTVSTNDSRAFVVHEVNLPDCVDIESLKSIWKDRLLVVRAETKEWFEKKFDTLDFEEDEVDVSVVDGGRLKVVFEKKSLSTPDSRSFTVHDVKLPDSLDLDSIRTTWEPGFLSVRANFNTTHE